MKINPSVSQTVFVVKTNMFDLFFRWVHLLCALYTPDVAFVKPEQLQCVTLSEVPPYKWGAKVIQKLPIDEITVQTANSLKGLPARLLS